MGGRGKSLSVIDIWLCVSHMNMGRILGDRRRVGAARHDIRGKELSNPLQGEIVKLVLTAAETEAQTK